MTTAELLAHPRVQAALLRIERDERRKLAVKHYEALAVAASKIGAGPGPEPMSDADATPYSRALPVDTEPFPGVSAPITLEAAA